MAFVRRLLALALGSAALAWLLARRPCRPSKPATDEHPPLRTAPPPDRAPEPVSEPTAEPEPAPASEPAPEPVSEPAPEPAPEPERAVTWCEPIDGECPPGYLIKVKLSSGIFHEPGGAHHPRVRPDRCYTNAAAAEADGFRRSKT